MSVPLPLPTSKERDLYPVHEEDSVPETPLHEEVVRYQRDAIAAFFADGYVTGNVCIYWEPGNYQRYVAPDLFVTSGSLADPDARVCLIWEDPPILFVAEIGSRSTRRTDEGTHLPIYADVLGVPEHLFADVETMEMRLRRPGAEGITRVVPPQPNGRLRSEQLQLEFEMADDGFVWVYTLDGTRLLTYTEENQRRQAAEFRAQEAESRAQEAESRAAEEAARRAELERELAALRAQLQDRDA